MAKAAAIEHETYAYVVTEGTYTAADGTRYRKGDTVDSPRKLQQVNLLPVAGVSTDPTALRRGPQPEVSTTTANKGKADPVTIPTVTEPAREKAALVETPAIVIPKG